jgi:hypothetical protein
LDQVVKLEQVLELQLNKCGFKKKRKNFFVNKVGDCIQHISVLETKMKGRNETHIIILVGFSYEKVNRVISFIQSQKYDKRWATANLNLAALVNPKQTYGFYINDETDVNCIVEDIILNLKRYSFDFFSSCDNMDKFYLKLINKDELVRLSTFALKGPEWNLLALSILLNHNDYEAIMNEYETEFLKNNYTVEKIRERIINYDVVKESMLL